jgi:hypothetical protein
MSSWRGGTDARLGRAFVVGALLALAGCQRSSPPSGGGTGRNDDAAVFQPCDSVCVRPGDCAQAFNDDGICPPGFLCILRYSGCTSD